MIHKNRKVITISPVCHQNALNVDILVHIMVKINRHHDPLLPVNDPITCEYQQKYHEFWISDDDREKFATVSPIFRNAVSLALLGPGKKSDRKEHGEDTTKDSDLEYFPCTEYCWQANLVRTCQPTDINHRVVDRVAQRTDVFAGGRAVVPTTLGFTERYA